MIALGNGVGPLAGGAFSQQMIWRWTFWLVVPLAALASEVVWLLLPKTNVEGDWKVKLESCPDCLSWCLDKYGCSCIASSQ